MKRIVVFLITYSLIFLIGKPIKLMEVAGYNIQDFTQRVLTAEDFANGRVERGSGREEVRFVIEINPKLVPLAFHLVPNLSAESTPGVSQCVGRIEISENGDSNILQTIEINSMAYVAMFISHFQVQDINFDGYLDIAVVSDFGGKWASHHYWVFDPVSERFITNELMEEIGKIGANEIVLDSKCKTIEAQYLNFDEAVVGEIYKIKNEHLVLVGLKERQKNKEGDFEIVTKRLVNGKMKVVKVEKD